MKRLIVPIILLVLFIFTGPCLAADLPNLFKPETRVPVDSKIDPWDIFIMVDGKRKCTWITEDIFPCPQGDTDMHIVISNPDPKAEIDKIELVIADGRSLLELGVLCSYSYMKDGEWHMFYYEFSEKRYVRYTGPIKYGHGGTIFDREGKK